MTRFPERFILQVQEATDIVEVVGQYVALKKRGKEFIGLCPFHDDHRPSLNVSPGKQIYKCFSCGAGGGVFQFLMQLEKMAFPEAVRRLAQRAGIAVPEVAAPAGQDRSCSNEVLTELCTFAARFYRDRLHSAEGADALAYARSRRLSDESIARFGLGFAPDRWDALTLAAGKVGYSDRQLTAAGLVGQREDGSCYDRFRNRLIFPIFDVAGKVIAFGGRALAADQTAKYLNSPETVLFDKSANLYALNWARPQIVQAGRAVVVEGYLDALMCHQAGIAHVVATLGTAMTERHVRMLSRYAGEIVLVFDADAAGQAAAERAIELFLAQRVNVRVATIPQGDAGQVKDPCDYVLAAGEGAMRTLLEQAPDALEFAWRRRLGRYEQAQSLAQKRAVIEEFLRLVVSSAAYGAIDALRQGLLVGHLSELVGISAADVTDRMRRVARQVAPARAGAPEPAAEPAGSERAERWVLAALLNAPELFGDVRERIDPRMFREPTLRTVAEQVWRLAGQGRLVIADLLGAGDSEQWGRLITDLQAAGAGRGNYPQSLLQAAEDLLRRRQKEQLQELRESPDADQTEVMRQVAAEARKPDRRRRPRP